MTCKACGYTDDFKVERTPEHGPGMLPGEKAFVEMFGLDKAGEEIDLGVEGLRTVFKTNKLISLHTVRAYACPSCGTLRIKA